jgi:drug/metabolite transporter (DMT)-like permease
VALQPLVTAIALWLTERKVPAKATFAAMLFALIGVGLVITKGHPSTLVHGGGTLGELMVLVGCVCWIVYTLGARRFADFSPLRYTAISAGYGTLTIFAITAIVALTGGTHVDANGTLAVQTLYIIVAGAIIAVLAWNDGVRRIGPANAALFLNLVPVISFAVAIGFQGYAPNGFEFAGAAITIAALVFNNLASRGRVPARQARPHPGGAPARAARSA